MARKGLSFRGLEEPSLTKSAIAGFASQRPRRAIVSSRIVRHFKTTTHSYKMRGLPWKFRLSNDEEGYTVHLLTELNAEPSEPNGNGKDSVDSRIVF